VLELLHDEFKPAGGPATLIERYVRELPGRSHVTGRPPAEGGRDGRAPYGSSGVPMQLRDSDESARMAFDGLTRSLPHAPTARGARLAMAAKGSGPRPAAGRGKRLREGSPET